MKIKLSKLVSQTIRKIAAIGFLVICKAGPYVLNSAHRIDSNKISRVCFHGKNKFVSKSRNKSY